MLSAVKYGKKSMAMIHTAMMKTVTQLSSSPKQERQKGTKLC